MTIATYHDGKKVGTYLDIQVSMCKYTLLLLFIFIVPSVRAQTVLHATTDTIYTATLKEVQVKALWKTDAERYKYNQMRFYVTTILPYVNELTRLFNDINTRSNDRLISRKELKRYISAREDSLHEEMKDHMDTLNSTQAVLLMKLTERQTNVNIYEVLKKFKNPFVAIKWQAWARLNGFNLNQRYSPQDEVFLESIMEGLGYPLPACYLTPN